jgi:hypothetical protein
MSVRDALSAKSWSASPDGRMERVGTPGDGQTRLGVGTQLLGLKQTSGQHALRSFGDVEDGFRRDRNLTPCR